MGTINVTPVFVLAGDATFTVDNGNGKHYTFHVYKSEPSQQYPNPAHFIEILTGPDNTTDYMYMGMVVHTGKAAPYVRITAKSKIDKKDPRWAIATWTLRVIWQHAYQNYKVPMEYSIRHSGNCGKCGQKLTTPASLDTGLGPECAAALGVEWREKKLAVPEPIIMGRQQPPDRQPGQRGFPYTERGFPYTDRDDADNIGHPGHPSNHGDS